MYLAKYTLVLSMLFINNSVPLTYKNDHHKDDCTAK